MPDHRRNGMRYEELARKQLQNNGLEFLQANYHCRFGEIDLVMRDQDTLCFIEVKYRSSTDYGGAACAISKSKQRKLIKSALMFSRAHDELSSLAMRFDAFLIQGQSHGEHSSNWIKNAFYAEQA